MLERLAKALGVEPLQLFSVTVASNESLERLIQQSITELKQEITGMKRVVIQAIEKNHAGECKAKNKA
jgi:hypothetical protein